VLARDKQCAQHHSRIQAFKHACTSLTTRIDLSTLCNTTTRLPLPWRLEVVTATDMRKCCDPLTPTLLLT
jgi:hypothetical protein